MFAGATRPYAAICGLIFLRLLLPAERPGSRFGPAEIKLHSRYLSVLCIFRSVMIMAFTRRNVVRFIAAPTFSNAGLALAGKWCYKTITIRRSIYHDR